MKTLKSKKGTILILTLQIMLLLFFISSTAASLYIASLFQTQKIKSQIQTHILSDAALEYGIDIRGKRLFSPGKNFKD